MAFAQAGKGRTKQMLLAPANMSAIGHEAALRAGHDLNTIHSVASFFVSRVDTEIDKRLEKIGSEDALGLRGQAGVANAPFHCSGAM